MKPPNFLPEWLHQLTFPPAVYEGFFFPYILDQHLLLVVFLIMAILTGMRWSLHVVLTCISFMDRDGEHFFMYFLAISVSSFRKFCLVQLPISLLVH
jgi:hypothetical protein